MSDNGLLTNSAKSGEKSPDSGSGWQGAWVASEALRSRAWICLDGWLVPCIDR